MLLKLSTTHTPATDLGFLLHKNPGRLHSAELTFGNVHLFYPEVSPEKCTAAVLVEVDPVKLVRGRKGPSGEGGQFDQYVNDRPYVASSFMSSAIVEFFGTAMSGRSKERQELANSAIPIEIEIPVIPCRGGESFLRNLFEPLGYTVEAQRLTLDERFPEWGESRYFHVKLSRTGLLKELLNHLYVLIPVLDDEKHYWVAKDEIDKLLRRAQDWLPSHPEKNEITSRYLRHQKHLTREALARLVEEDPDPDATEEQHGVEEEKVERPISLNEQRLNAVLGVLKDSGARSVLDLGCGEGRLINLLLKERQFTKIVGVDVVYSVLERAQRKLRLDRLPPMVAQRLQLMQGSLVYRDTRLSGFDAAAVVEVIEHLDPPRLNSFERAVFEFARPGAIAITTPNSEYNVLFETMPAGAYRHRDHRFEWTRSQFREWAAGLAERHGYSVRFAPIGPVDETHGSPTQMAVFTR